MRDEGPSYLLREVKVKLAASFIATQTKPWIQCGVQQPPNCAKFPKVIKVCLFVLHGLSLREDS